MFPEISRYKFYPPHLTAKQARLFIGARIFDQLFTFGMVRDPFDRALSFYRYRLQKNHLPPSMSFADYIGALEQRDPRWFRYAPFWMSASDFVLHNDNTRAVSRIIRYEKRREELAEIRRILGISHLGSENRNISNFLKKHYSNQYDVKTKELVERLFLRDLENFGYGFAE